MMTYENMRQVRRAFAGAYRCAEALGHKLEGFDWSGITKCSRCGAEAAVDMRTLEAGGEAVRRSCQGLLMLSLRIARRRGDDTYAWKRVLQCALERWHADEHDIFAVDAMHEAFNFLRNRADASDMRLQEMLHDAAAILIVWHGFEEDEDDNP